MVIRNLTLDVPQPYNKIGDGPEGPEARVMADELHQDFQGVTVVKFTNHGLKQTGELQLPAVLNEVRSYGKKVIWDLSTGQSMVFSQGMAGRFTYLPAMPGEKTMLTFNLVTYTDEGKQKGEAEIYYENVRAAVSSDVTILQSSELPDFFSRFGPDLLAAALGTPISSVAWKEIFRARPRAAISNLLNDQEVIAGIGNYLRADILYAAKIHPKRKVNELSDVELEELRLAAHRVIKEAYEGRGLTIANYLSPNGRLGVYRALVYSRSVDDAGHSVAKISKKGAQTLWYVPEVQV